MEKWKYNVHDNGRKCEARKISLKTVYEMGRVLSSFMTIQNSCYDIDHYDRKRLTVKLVKMSKRHG